MYENIEKYARKYFPYSKIHTWYPCRMDNHWKLSIGEFPNVYTIVSYEDSRVYDISSCTQFYFKGLSHHFDSYSSFIYFKIDSNLDVLFSLIKDTVEADIAINNSVQDVLRNIRKYHDGDYIDIYRDKKINEIITEN